MQAELAVQRLPLPQTANVGDVLASIRRLIAQETPPEAVMTKLPAPSPLVLSQTDQVAPPPFEDPAMSEEEAAEFAEAEAALARMLAPPAATIAVIEEIASPLEAPEGTQGPELRNMFLAPEGHADREDLRSLIRASLREEMEGEMGATFSRNLHRVIRQEIEAVIREAAIGP
ncbi:hypothetical protein [Paracoccus sp. KR1-242]|uniref:hypothetical protein n=1 Tax=Paracoccus sp. KR1-242 TaxID=3410028 RepID=UPI003C075122